MFGFNDEELKILKSLNTPRKIQDFLNGLKINFEEEGDTCMSPRMVLKTGKAHCMEGAMLAAVALRLQGHPPLVVDLVSTPNDDDHVLTVFKQHGHWGAITKTNHAVLRYREPIYKTIRELVMSYFHEYTLDDGRKTLRSYSMPLNLAKFDSKNWMTSEENVWYIPEYLDNIPHKKILNRAQIITLRRADIIEREVGKIVEWKKLMH
ncbi:hypothetical protein C4573_02835 [Candidatus Woesearchaeota archaeon]|nr:MAG: hypothetical protein C4573_02835 [Candidatus Woesearchaeota archaeon]